MKVLFEVKGLNWSELECKEAFVKMFNKEVEILSFSVDVDEIELLVNNSLSPLLSNENVNGEEVLSKEKKKKIVKKKSKKLLSEEKVNTVEEEKVNVEEVLVAEEKKKKIVKKNSKKVLSQEEKEEEKAKKKEETKAKKEEEKAKKKEETKAKKEEEKAKKKEETKAKKEEEKANKKSPEKFCATFPKVAEETKAKKNSPEKFCATLPKVAEEEKEIIHKVAQEEFIKIIYEGKEYMKLIKGNLVLDMDEEDVGRFNETTKKIDFYQDEELEEEYEK